MTAMLLQSPFLVLFAISLTLADIVYRLRSASLTSHTPVAALVGGPSMRPPLWLLAGQYGHAGSKRTGTRWAGRSQATRMDTDQSR